MAMVSAQTAESKLEAKASVVMSTGRFLESEFHRLLSDYVSEERTVATRPRAVIRHRNGSTVPWHPKEVGADLLCFREINQVIPVHRRI